MIGKPAGIEWALIGLFLFGIIYAYVVYRLGDKHQGYTWLLVVIGVVVTVATAGPLIGWGNVSIIALLFAASGSPMAFGDIISAIIERNRRERAVNEQLSKLADWGISIAASEVPDDNPKKAAR